jgi:pimeloyl-ACP methyl ester carboxylesterase
VEPSPLKRRWSLVLLPGLDGTGEMFGPLLPELPDWLLPIVVRYPRDKAWGYAQLLPLAARSLPTDTPSVILGESFAGPLAVMLARRGPPGLRGLILCASFVRNPLRLVPSWLSAAAVTPLFRLWPPLLAVRSYPRRREFGQLLPLALAAIRSVRPEAVAARVRALMTVDVREDLRTLDLPLLYLEALHDQIVRGHNVEGIKKLRPDAQVVRFDTRHFLLQLEPRRAAAAIVSFVESLPA